MKKQRLFKIVLTAILIALNVILERFIPVLQLANIKLSFGFITVAFAACYLGCASAIAVAGIGDIIGAVVMPVGGAYFPGFTVTNVIVALCLWAFLYKKATVLKITLAVTINTITCSLFLNTMFIAIVFTKNIARFWPLFIGRAPAIIVTAIIQIIIISILFTDKSKINHLIKKTLPY